MNGVRDNRDMRLNPTLVKVVQLVFALSSSLYQKKHKEESIENCYDGQLRIHCREPHLSIIYSA